MPIVFAFEGAGRDLTKNLNQSVFPIEVRNLLKTLFPIDNLLSNLVDKKQIPLFASLIFPLCKGGLRGIF